MVKIVIATRVVVTILTCSMTGKTIYGKTFVKKNNNNGVRGWNDSPDRMTPQSFHPREEMTPPGIE